jgi:mannan endo-1,4-beta-mannosidase
LSSVRSARLLFGACLTLAPALSPLNASVALTVDLSAAVKPISPLIYGLNDWTRDASTDSLGYTFQRFGGNQLTSYNWELNVVNAGIDWYNWNTNGIVATAPVELQSVPGEAAFLFIDYARAHGQTVFVALPLSGYVAADKNGVVTAEEAAPGARWKKVIIDKGAPLLLSPDTSDDYVFLDEEVNLFLSKYGKASEGGVFAYEMDNEPSIWPTVHPLQHPAKTTCAEVISQNVAAMKMVRRMDESALTFGPVFWGWGAFTNFSDAPDWTGALQSQYGWFVSYYLAQMKAASDAAGGRLLDVLDVHYYPAGTGKDDSGQDANVYSQLTSAGVNAARMQAPRSLWDPTYTETSWITQYTASGPLRILPRLQASIDVYYPGTKIAVTEYEYGGHKDISGGIAQADVLGIYGKYGVFAACFYSETIKDYIFPAFHIYLDYDGKGSAFGDLSLATNAPDAASYSVYAAKESGTGRIHIIAINKTATAEVANVSLANTSRIVTSAEVYGFSEAGGAVLSELTPVASISGNAFSYTLPAHSVLHFVFADPHVAGLKAEQDAGASLVHLYFRTTPGVAYRLQSGTNLSDWINVDQTTYEGDGGVLLVNRPLPSVETFWRFVPVN